MSIEHDDAIVADSRLAREHRIEVGRSIHLDGRPPGLGQTSTYLRNARPPSDGIPARSRSSQEDIG